MLQRMTKEISAFALITLIVMFHSTFALAEERMVQGTVPKMEQVALNQMGVPVAAGIDLKSKQILKIEQMTKEQFEALPDNAIIEFKGKQTTKKQFLADREQKIKQAKDKVKANLSSKAQADFEARHAKFLKEQKEKLDTENARVQTEFARLLQQSNSARSSQFETIRQEALQLNNKWKLAIPSEQEQIKKRADELLQQLKGMGY